MGPHPLVGGEPDATALIAADTGETVSFDELGQRVEARGAELAHLSGGLVLLGVSPTPADVVDYLALTQVGATVALLDPASAATAVAGWVEAYQPDAVWGFSKAGDILGDGPSLPAAPEGVLLPTSGSTGSPKFVRLAAGSLHANAEQIAEALHIAPGDRALGHLPLFYSFGLSVLNSHLLTGACTVLTSASAMRPEFWSAMVDQNVSSLPGVPYSYEMFIRVGLLEKDLPHLRDLTQAGGRMATERIIEIHEAMAPKGVRLWIMYGQTEACARISVLPADQLPEAAGSVGYPLPGGSIEVVDPDDSGEGELVYTGPNVMLGYCTDRHSLSGLDECHGRLHTGDLGRLDDQGRMWITGRLKRIAKVFGTRVSLDDVEAQLASFGTVAAVDDDVGVTVYVESDDDIEGLGRKMERHLGFPARSVRAVAVAHLPTTAAGKIDYQALQKP